MGGYRGQPRSEADADEKATTPTTPRKNESPMTPRKSEDGEKKAVSSNSGSSTPTKEDLSLKGKLPATAASVASPRGVPPSPSAASHSPWSPRAGTLDISRYRESADILLLRLANAFFDLVKKTQQTLPALERTNAFTGEEIQNKLQEWLECDKDTAFLYASSLLQQGFLFHASLGVFIETSIVCYNIKDPVLIHYARCMRRGLGKECLHLKKGASSKKNKCEGCFSGTEAVDWMLLNFPHLVKKLRVESVGNAIAVSEALLEQGIIESVKQKADSKKVKPFCHDDKHFFRFKGRLFKTRPVDGKALVLNPLPAQLEFIACESLLDGIKPTSQYITSSSSNSSELPTTPDSRKRVGFESAE
ncbi:uncharacterized protein ACA1_173670 [Acanthamoeba castellanii str. Neff]|uniref:DEP domain-containing protein n=1 Tax=Acanthamoeba castellanii (strain ATCC 30010 / Neff) TaxID=1257118 RepID=L8HGP4_ACACF|nr:uncharacterized protein ACA1_173670 [Acanthamoeba castellanii str. Neff]ELR24719.1 hypothetical protein ACA1_173670 [Acanthamoeba castellanii str. Neff]